MIKSIKQKKMNKKVVNNNFLQLLLFPWVPQTIYYLLWFYAEKSRFSTIHYVVNRL